MTFGIILPDLYIYWRSWRYRIAAKLEAAANISDTGTIHTEHDNMMEEYEVLTAVIRSLIPKSATDPENDDIKEFSPSDDIMEFLPGGDNEE